jgi:hypothetical protein
MNESLNYGPLIVRQLPPVFIITRGNPCVHTRASTISKGTAEEIQQGKTRVYQLLAAGILDGRKSGKSTRVTGESIQRYVESLPKAEIRTGQKAEAAQQPPQPV